jgi:TctA family transporter
MKNLTVIEAQLTRVLGFFPRVDTKIAGLFTVNSAILTISALNVEAGDLKQWYVTIPGVLMVVGLLASYFFLYRAHFPNLNGGQGSLIYFSTISDRTEANFITEYEAATDAQYRSDMLGQIWRNSHILCEKYKAIAIAVRITLATLLPVAVFLIMTAIEHSRVPVVNG